MLDSPLPRLHASPPADLSFSKVSQVRSFVLERDAGDLMIYASKSMPHADVTAQYLNHWHELMVGGADAIHAPLVIHEADRAAAEGTRPVDRTFTERTTLDGDFELIPIPGHTPGATAFLWDSGEHRLDGEVPEGIHVVGSRIGGAVTVAANPKGLKALQGLWPAVLPSLGVDCTG